jgi:4-hydroxy-tetrahydrodipicolinate reductase
VSAKLKTIRIVQYGLGHIGREVVRLLLRKPQFLLVGVIDNDPLKAGRRLADFLENGARTALRISNDAEACLRKARPDAVIHTTGSSVLGTLPQLEQIVRAGAHCVSSTEELLYPQLRNPATARRLHRLAKEKGVAVLGTGVNPGFVMDLLTL